jgi:acyl dehydratase
MVGNFGAGGIVAVSSKHILQQGPVIAGLVKTAAAALKQQIVPQKDTVTAPGPVFRRTIEPRPKDLVRDYVRHVGGNPREYRDHLPPHLFPQWGFALSTRTLTNIPYPLMRVMNGGCRMEIHAPLPTDEPLDVSAQLVSIDDNGRRAVLHQKIVTGTRDVPEALVGHFYAVVPLSGGKGEEKKRKSKEEKKKRREKPRVPEGVREVTRWWIPADAGLDFAKLTGDFNPIHWVRPHAKMMGFKNVILHGFSTMARAYEGLNQQLFKGLGDFEVFDVKFTRPLVLPAEVGLYVDDDNGVYVGDAPGGPAYMVGSFELG